MNWYWKPNRAVKCLSFLARTTNLIVPLIALICAVSGSLPFPALAGSIWDESFDISLTRGAGVFRMAGQPDGKIVIVGDFSEVEGVPRQSIARLNADGTLDADFNPGPLFDAGPLLVAAQPDGKLLVGGITRDYRFTVERFNLNGSLDSAFDFGTGIEPSRYSGLNAYDMLLLPDGKLLVAGHFNRVQGQTMRCVARFNPDGSLDSDFNANAYFGVFDTVNHLYLREDGDVFFTAVYDGGIIPFFGFGRFNEEGSVDPTISLNTGGWARVDTLSFASDQRLILLGEFYGLDGDWPRYAVRLNPDNTVDETYSLPLSFWPAVTKPLADGRTLLMNIGDSNMLLNTNGDWDVNFTNNENLAAGDAVLQPDGRIVATGSGPATTNGQVNFGLVRLLHNGSLDSSFSVPGGIMAACGEFQEVVLQPDGKLLLRSDDATFANGQPVSPPLMRFLANGSIDTNFIYSGPYLFGERPTPLAAQTDGKLLLGSLDRVFRLESTGETDPGFDLWMPCETADRIVTLPDGGTLVISEVSTLTGCQVWQWNVVSIRRIRADGSVDPEFTVVRPNPSQRECFPDPDFGPICWEAYSEVRHIVPSGTNGGFYVAGKFNSLSGIDRTNLARILPNGQVDAEFHPVVSSPVAGMGVLANGDVGVLADDGWLSVFDPTGAIRNRAMLLGGMPHGVRGVWFAPDETFVVGGFPTSEPSFRLLRFSLDGSLAGNCRFAANFNQLRGIMQPDGNMIFSGLFPRAGGTHRSAIRRLNFESLQSFRLHVLPSNESSLILEMEGPPGWRFAIQGSANLTAWQTMPVYLTTTAPENRIEIPIHKDAEFFRVVITE